MNQPYLDEFRTLIRRGAGTLDIHDVSTGADFAVEVPAYEALVEREVARVGVHLSSLCRLLSTYVGRSPEVLDVGCGTGATTVAIALTPDLGVRRVLGVDPNGFSLEAARIRALGHDVPADRIDFIRSQVGAELPVDRQYDLCVCVSVLEYLWSPESRRELIRQMIRATKVGGKIFLATPNPIALFDYHSGRVFGDFRRRPGFPWASTGPELRRMFTGCEVRFLRREQLAIGLENRGVHLPLVAQTLGPLGYVLPWQKIIATRRE